MLEKNYTNVFVLAGDEQRYEYAKQTFGVQLESASKYLQKNVLVVPFTESEISMAYLRQFSTDPEAADLQIEVSDKLPFGVIIFIPHSGKEPGKIKTLLREKEFTKVIVAVFDNFPFEDSYTDKFIRFLKRKLRETHKLEAKIIIGIQNRQFGNSDVDNVEQTVELARKHYEANIDENLVFGDVELLKDYVINVSSGLKDNYAQKMDYHLENWNRDRTMKIEEDNCYPFTEEALSRKYLTLDIKQKLIEFNSLEKINVVQSYFINGKSQLFVPDSETMREVFSYYDSQIRNICFWDKTKDYQAIQLLIENEFKKQLSKLFINDVRVPKTRPEYISLMQERNVHLDIKFKNILNHFFEVDIRNLILNYCQKHVDKIQKQRKKYV